MTRQPATGDGPESVRSDDQLSAVRAEVHSAVVGKSLALMLYGSQARGDADHGSDVDVLQLTAAGGTHYQVGRVSIAVYSVAQLRRMARIGSLFALHLRTEGVILEDHEGILREALSLFKEPPSYDSLWKEVCAASQVLDAPAALLEANPVGLNRLALYLTRIVGILRHHEMHGTYCFSTGELARALELPEYASLFEGRELEENLNSARFHRTRQVLEQISGCEIRNPYGTIEALAVNLDADHPTVSRLAVRILGGQENLGYGDLLLDPSLPPDV